MGTVTGTSPSRKTSRELPDRVRRPPLPNFDGKTIDRPIDDVGDIDDRLETYQREAAVEDHK